MLLYTDGIEYIIQLLLHNGIASVKLIARIKSFVVGTEYFMIPKNPLSLILLILNILRIINECS